MLKRSVLVLVICLVTACGSSSGDETGAASPEASLSAQASPSAEATSPLVGLWQRDNTCQEIVAGLEEAVLPLSIAPGLIADNGYVSGSVEQLAERDDPCEGAIPRAHAHFFSADGEFGSLDWNNQQVDDGMYTIVNDRSLMIGDAKFLYEVSDDGDTLTLAPVIPKAALAEARKHPEDFDYGWNLAVAFFGHTWERVDCGGWC